MSTVRSGEIKGEIKALTGLRIIAAVWVVLFAAYLLATRRA